MPITTDEDFRMAINWLIDNGQLPVQGNRVVSIDPRRVSDQRGSNLVDITPNSATLEAALNAVQAEQSEAQQREAARLLALQAVQGNKIALVLAAIASDSTDIDTDLTTLGNLAVLSLLTFRPLMTRMLNRQARIENRLEMIFKILSHE